MNEATLVRAKGHVGAEVGQRVIDMLNRTALLPKVAGLHSAASMSSTTSRAASARAWPMRFRPGRRYHQTPEQRARPHRRRRVEGEIEVAIHPEAATVRDRHRPLFPTALLSFGWWDRVNRGLDREIKWQDPALQQWLFSGFEQWALLGPQRLVDRKAVQPDRPDRRERRGQLHSGPDQKRGEGKKYRTHGFAACRQCQCCRLPVSQISHLRTLPTLGKEDTAFLESIKELSSAQYYLVLQDNDDLHTVEPVREEADYSGYIWQCWAPKEWVPAEAYDTRLPGAYFIWEHTNFADPDVIRYGLDSMDRKVGYLRKRLQERMDLSGELVLLQHLMPSGRLRGENERGAPPPAISTEHFRRLFQHRGDEDGGA